MTPANRTMPKFTNPICRGSYVLGSACGKCERCEWEREQPPEPRDGGDVVERDITPVISDLLMQDGYPGHRAHTISRLIYKLLASRGLLKTPGVTVPIEALQKAMSGLKMAQRDYGVSQTIEDGIEALRTFLPEGKE